MFIIILLILAKATVKEVVYVRSDIDGRKYMVRDLEDKQKAANMLARLRLNINKLTKYMSENKDEYPDFAEYITRLENRIYHVVINETGENSTYTSYTVNKGEQIVFCLRSKRILHKIHDINLIMYVLLHEIAHVACPETGHTPLFKRIFEFFAKIAVEIGLYKKINFEVDPKEYCGIVISHSII